MVGAGSLGWFFFEAGRLFFLFTELVWSICFTVELLWVGLVLAVLLLFHPKRVSGGVDGW